MKILRVLILSLIVTTISGCATKIKYVEPLCLSAQPVISDISVADQLLMRDASMEGFTLLAFNDVELKSWIRETKLIVAAHNEQFKATCD